MKLFLVILGAMTVCWTACDTPVEGCIHPRSFNFNAEANANVNCVYYQLELQWQHYSATQQRDTLFPRQLLVDAAGNNFYVESCQLLGSKVYLTKVGSNTPTTSPEVILLGTNDNGNQNIADNFFGIRLDQYVTTAGSWVELGEFDQLTLQLGLDTKLQVNNPPDFAEARRPILPINGTMGAHPLAMEADPFLYDSTSLTYPTLQLTIVQPNTMNRVTKVQIDDVVPLSFAYPAVVQDGANVPIRLRLDYDLLFQGIRWDTDSSTIANQLSQNLPLSLSTY